MAYVQRLKEMTRIELFKIDFKESANQFYQMVNETRNAGCFLDANVQKKLLI